MTTAAALGCIYLVVVGYRIYCLWGERWHLVAIAALFWLPLLLCGHRSSPRHSAHDFAATEEEEEH